MKTHTLQAHGRSSDEEKEQERWAANGKITHTHMINTPCNTHTSNTHVYTVSFEPLEI